MDQRSNGLNEKLLPDAVSAGRMLVRGAGWCCHSCILWAVCADWDRCFCFFVSCVPLTEINESIELFWKAGKLLWWCKALFACASWPHLCKMLVGHNSQFLQLDYWQKYELKVVHFGGLLSLYFVSLENRCNLLKCDILDFSLLGILQYLWK